jgi:signal transduction histidine kinase
MAHRAAKVRRVPKKPRPVASAGYGSLVFDVEGRLLGASGNAGPILGLAEASIRPGTSYRALRAAVSARLRPALPTVLGKAVRVARVAGVASLTLPIPGLGFQISVSSEPDAWAAAELATREGIRLAMLESSRDAIALFDPDDRLVAFNRNMTTLMGPNADLFVIGAHLEDIVRTLEARGYYRGIERGIDKYLTIHATQGTEPLHFVYTYADGRVIEAVDRRTEQGITVLVRADITERVERERELADQNLLLGIALANMSNGLTYYDAEARLRLWNDRYEEMFGLPAGTLRAGMTHRDVFRAIIGDDLIDPATGAERTEPIHHIGNRDDAVLRRTTKDGRVIEVRHKPVEHGGGVATFIDITALEEARRKLEAALADARRADALKSIFLANVTHELRTPLNAITGFSELLASEHYGPINDKQREFVDSIASGGQHLLGLIDGIIDLTRIEAQQIRLDVGPVDLAHLVGLTLRTVEAARHGRPTARIVTDLASGLPDVLADDGKLRQILTNLIGNAVKFTPPEGEVTVRARAEGAECILEVADTGPGIAPDDLARVFEPFYRAQTATTRAVEGSGLGLPLAKSLAELHGGRLEIRSTLGRGTVVTLHLPCAPSTETPRTQA